MYVDEGGLLAFGPNYRNVFRRAAIYVDKILKGTNRPAGRTADNIRSVHQSQNGAD
jgi:ABC-type uncharacterized transport system substrate-binding protein